MMTVIMPKKMMIPVVDSKMFAIKLNPKIKTNPMIKRGIAIMFASLKKNSPKGVNRPPATPDNIPPRMKRRKASTIAAIPHSVYGANMLIAKIPIFMLARFSRF